MARVWELEYSDGDRAIVLAPPILDEADITIKTPTNTTRRKRYRLNSHLIKEWQTLLRNEMYRKLTEPDASAPKLWPPEEVAELCYASARVYYQKIGELLDPSLRIDELDPVSRHLFFVCTAPISKGQNVYLGLSGLEQLMGYTLVEQPEGESSGVKIPDRYTTGDTTLDVLTSTVLIFKRKGWELATMLGVEDLAKMNTLANELMRPKKDGEDEEGDGAIDVPVRDVVETPEFAEKKPRILQGLRDLGVEPPPGF